jgi:hypothetical protein
VGSFVGSVWAPAFVRGARVDRFGAVRESRDDTERVFAAGGAAGTPDGVLETRVF